MFRLSKDATLASLKMSWDYLDGVLANILEAEDNGLDPDKIRIRSGITGQGVQPNYRIESSDLEGIEELIIRAASGSSISVKLRRTGLHKIFRGANHSEMAKLEGLESHEESWSTDTLSGSQVKLMLNRNR